MNRYAPGRKTENVHIIRIATECPDILLYPLKGSNLVHIGVTAFWLLWVLFTQLRKCKMAEASQTIVDGHQNDALFGKFLSRGCSTGADSAHKSTAMNPYHHAKLCALFGQGRPPDIQKKTIFRRAYHNATVRNAPSILT